MASNSHDGGGYRRILFTIGGKRQAIHLGKMSLKSAQTVRDGIEAIVEAKTVNRSLDADTAKWLRDVDDDLYAKLAGKGLAAPRGKPEQATVGPFIDGYMPHGRISNRARRST
jgi:hypothetical protein